MSRGERDVHQARTRWTVLCGRHRARAAFDKPEARLMVDPVVVERDIAVASWTQGETGGRALLRRKHGTWSIVLCGGDGLKEAAALGDFGLSAAEATTFADRIAAVEASVPEDRRIRFSRFEGVMQMEHSGH